MAQGAGVGRYLALELPALRLYWISSLLLIRLFQDTTRCWSCAGRSATTACDLLKQPDKPELSRPLLLASFLRPPVRLQLGRQLSPDCLTYRFLAAGLVDRFTALARRRFAHRAL